MNNKNTILKSSMTQGAILGLALLLPFLLFYLFGNIFSPAIRWIQNFFLIAGCYLYMKMVRDSIMEGKINFGKAFLPAMSLTFFASIILAFGNYLVYTFDRKMFGKYIAFLENAIGQIDMGEELSRVMQENISLISPGMIAMSVIIDVLFRGLFFSLILALLIKKKP